MSDVTGPARPRKMVLGPLYALGIESDLHQPGETDSSFSRQYGLRCNGFMGWPPRRAPIPPLLLPGMFLRVY